MKRLLSAVGLFVLFLPELWAATGPFSEPVDFPDNDRRGVLEKIEKYLQAHPEATLRDLPLEYRQALTSDTAEILNYSDPCNVVPATIMAFAAPIVGLPWLPVHRFILGGYSLQNTIIYAVTCGGCGILPIADGIILLYNNLFGKKSMDRYCNCHKFFLWDCGRPQKSITP